MFGRRPDGKRVKKLDPIIQMTPYLMPMRCDAQVFLDHKADYEKLSRYIAQKSREDHLHADPGSRLRPRCQPQSGS